MAFTVTATQGGTGAANGTLLTVKVLTGAAAASSQSGATAHSSSITVPQLSITPTATGSWIYGAVINGGGSLTFTANGSTTLSDNVADSTDNRGFASFRSTGTTTASTPVTIGCSGPTIASGDCILTEAEILANGTLAEDASSPAAVQTTTKTASSASFTPPAGSLLVAMVSGNTATGSPGTLTMSDTSGLGLTWTQLTPTTTICNVAVFVAQIPSGNTTSTGSVALAPMALAGSAPVPITSTGSVALAPLAISAYESIQPVGSPSGGPWTLAFDEEFSTPYATSAPTGTGPNPAVWADHYIGGDGQRTNNAGAESEWYAHDYYGHTVSGGQLTLTATYQGPSGVLSIDPTCTNPMINGETPEFTSGMISSYRGLNFTYGYVEASIKFDTSPSDIWTAFWMQPSDATDPPPEFDIQEYGGGGQPERSTFHIVGGALSGPFNPSGSPDLTQFHTYGFRWTPTDVTFFMDGTSIGTDTTSGDIPSKAMHLMCNLQTEATSGTGYPGTMTVDYIRMWTLPGAPTTPVVNSISPASGQPTSSQITVNFTTNGATSYRAMAIPVDYLADKGVIGAPASYTATGSSSPLTITGLDDTVRYYVTVSAVTSGLYSLESLPTPALTTSSEAAIALAPMALAGTAKQVFTCTGSLPLAPMALSGTESAVNASSGSVALAPMALSGSAKQVNTSTGSVALAPMALAGTATQVNTSSGSVALAPMAEDGTATNAPAGSATGSLAMAPMGMSGEVVSIGCSGGLALAPLGCGSTATQVHTSSGSVALAPLAESGTGLETPAGSISGSVALSPMGMSGTAQSFGGSGGLAAPGMTLGGSGSVTEPSGASGSAGLPAMALAGQGTQIISASGSLSLSPLRIASPGGIVDLDSNLLSATIASDFYDGTVESDLYEGLIE